MTRTERGGLRLTVRSVLLKVFFSHGLRWSRTLLSLVLDVLTVQTMDLIKPP